MAEVGALPDSELRDNTCGVRDVLYAEAEAGVLGLSSVGFSLSLAIVESEFVREPRSEGLRRNEQRTGRSACATKKRFAHTRRFHDHLPAWTT